MPSTSEPIIRDAAAPAGIDLAALATFRGFLLLTLPLAAGAGVNWAMHFTNRLFLSWYSPDALAAALPAGMLVYLLQAFFTVSVGYVGAFAAQHVGADEPERAGAMAWPMLWLALMAGAVGFLLIPCRHGLMSIYGAEAGVTADMEILGAWYLSETLPAVVLAGLCGWFGGLGRTRLVLLLSLGVCLLSVLLNHWLIFGGLGIPSLGLHGAGLAMVLATTVGCVAALAVFFGPRVRRQYGTWRTRGFAVDDVRHFLTASLPRGATECLEMVAMVMFTAAVARLGSEALAASNLVFSLYLLVLIPLIGLGQGITIAVGQAVGAGRIDIARGVVRHSAVVVLTVLVLGFLPFALFPVELMQTHVQIDPADPAASQAKWDRILALGQPLMWIACAAALGDGIQIIGRFAVQGAGDTRWPLVALTLAAILTMGLPTLALVWWVAPERFSALGVHPLTACWLVFGAYLWLIGAIMAWRYVRGPWARMSLRR